MSLTTARKQKWPSFHKMKIILTLLVLWTLWTLRTLHAEVPEDYQANYGIAVVRDAITKDFVTIQAQKKIGQQIDTTIFNRLSSNLWIVLPKLPQKNNYKVTFEQCQLITTRLANGFSNLDFDTFVDQCQWPLNTIMKDINNNYSIKAKIKANPTSGPAPLTVTFDARDSIDPSQDTIPANNFFWYYKNNEGNDILIGKWAIVKHNFEVEGNYLVHLTSRSVNNLSEGILDGEATVSINVSPETANLVVYANGKKLQNKTYTKIGTAEAQRGVTLDATPSQPKWGREITKHRRDINGANGFRFQSEEFPTKPGSLTVPLPNNGAYTINLTITDNENNVITKSYLLAVSDPIAIIKQTPEKLTTSQIARFDGSASYAIQSRIKQYSRELFDEAGERLFASQTKDFSRQFSKPGTYTVKLKVTDDLWQANEESQTIFVDSTEPQAQFTISPRLDWELPSQFILDASSSSDKDVTAGNDALTYEWSFSNPEQAKIEQSYDANKSIVVSFSDPGKYKAKLIVSDSYGKVTTLEKEIEVKSALRPIVYVTPRASVWWQPIVFIVKANDSIINYDRDFADGTRSTIQEASTKKVFNKVWKYNVKLTVTGKRGQTNTITTPVFIGEKDLPVGAYNITNMTQNIIKPIDNCSGTEAFPIKRLEKFSVDINESVNGRWEKQNLNFFFQPIDDEIYQTNRFQYDFKKVWCLYIDTIIEDTSNSKQDRKRIWFKVTNSLPTLNSITLWFPQFWNEIGVGLGQGTQEKTFDPTKVNPLIVKVNAISPKDNDGFITQYIWYYYKKDDPSRKIDLKPTPANSPNTFFSIFSEPGEIVFGVKMIDNDGGEVTSEEIIGQWPTIFIPPQGKNSMDIPIVTLITDKVNVSIGEEVAFTTKAKILSNRPDFDAKKTIQYDFDGDGVRDKTTKENSVKYTYTKPYPDGVRPRVQVTYRWFPVTTDGDTITVKDGLRAIMQYAIYDNTIIARDYSYGKIAQKELCFDGRVTCKDWIKLTDGFATYTYPKYGQYMTVFTINDSYGNTAVNRQLITSVQSSPVEDPYVLSIPQSKKENGTFIIPVGEQSENSVLIHIRKAGNGICYIDQDSNYDSNNDNNSANDQDILCNKTQLIKYRPLTQTITAKLIYEKPIQWQNRLVSNDIVMQFIDQKVNLDANQDKLYKKIVALNNTIPNSSQEWQWLQSLLEQLAQSLVINKDPTDIILQIRDFIQTNAIWLTPTQSTTLDEILNEMSNWDIVAALWWSSYDQAKANIIQFAPEAIKVSIRDIFSQIEAIEEPAAQADKVKEHLMEVLNIFNANAVPDSEIIQPGNENKVALSDIEITIMPEVCKILWFYNIASEQCRPVEDGGGGTLIAWSLESTTTESSPLMTILKRIGIIVAILWGVFVLIVLFFAVKARLQQNKEEEAQGQTNP